MAVATKKRSTKKKAVKKKTSKPKKAPEAYWVNGARIPDGVDAETFLAECQELGEGFKAEDMLAFAEANPESEIAKSLDWDDVSAARSWRLQQCQYYARQIRFRIITVQRRVVRDVRTFQHVGGGNRRTKSVIEDKDLRAELVARVLTRLSGIRQQYHMLHELDEVWDAIEDAEKELV